MSNVKVVFTRSGPISDFDVQFPSDHEEENQTKSPVEQNKTEAGRNLDNSMDRISSQFINSCESHLFITPFIMSGLLGLVASTINVEFKEILDREGNKIEEEGDKTIYEISEEKVGHIWVILDKIDSIKHASDGYERSLIIQLSTIFDILIAGLVEQIAILKPSVLEASDRKLDFADIGKYSNIEDIKKYFLDKIIDSVVRRSRSDQFAWIADKLGIPLTKNLDGWCDFVEINERRNLFTHTEGLVTKEYIENCTNAGCKIENLGKIGDKLEAGQKYVTRASELFFVIGVKLTQVVWRKLSEDFCEGHIGRADVALLMNTYELNRSEKYKISAQIGSFACGEVIKRHGSEKTKRMLYMNYAAALMLQGRQKDAHSVLNRLDWEAVSLEFSISVAAVKGDIEQCCSIMPKAVRAGVLSKADLEEWPVFYAARANDRFINTFRDIFGEEYVGRTTSKQISASQVKEVSSQIKKMARHFREQRAKTNDAKLLH